MGLQSNANAERKGSALVRDEIANEINIRLNPEVLERRELLALIESPAVTPPTQPLLPSQT